LYDTHKALYTLYTLVTPLQINQRTGTVTMRQFDYVTLFAHPDIPVNKLMLTSTIMYSLV